MKKMNNRGFLLVESLVVTTFVLTVLVFLFVQFKNLFNSYENSYDYNTVEGIYNLNTFKNYLTSPDVSVSRNGNYTVIFEGTSCSNVNSFNNDVCNNLGKAMNLKTLIYLDESKLDSLKDSLKDSGDSVFTSSYKDFLSRLKEQSNDIRLIGQFNDGTYATITYDAPEIEVTGGILKSYGSSSNEDFHADKSSITSVVFEDDVTSAPDTAIDISEKGDKSVLYWITDNTTLHIGGNGGVYANYNSSYLFAGFTNLESINLSNLNMGLVVNAEGMFMGCSKLKEITGLNLSKITNTSKMFKNCTNLENLDLSSLDKTDKVTDMSEMFAGCTNLKTLKIDNFNTSSVTNMNSMFAGCEKLESLDVSSFNTEKVIDMRSMFNGVGLTELNLCNFNTKKIRWINGIFNDSKLTSVKVAGTGENPNWNIEDGKLELSGNISLVKDSCGGDN